MYSRIWLDMLILLFGCIVGNIVFNNFAKHLPVYRRVLKYVVLFSVLGAIGLLLGRIVFWSVIGLMVVGLAILHGWWLPRNGVNGLTAEPRDRYLALIGGRNRHRTPGSDARDSADHGA